MISSREFAPETIFRNRYLIAMTMTMAAMMELLDTSIVNVAISQIMGNVGATLEEVTWVSTSYIVANVIVLPISGWLSEYFGRRRYFMGSIALFIVASFFCGNAGSLESLVFWRILQGVGGGGLLATAQSTIYEVFPVHELGTGMAIFGLGIMVGPTLGPTIGGYITYHFSWPWIFYINLPIGLLALLLADMYVPDSRFHAEKKHTADEVDWWGLILIALSIGTLQLMLEQGERLQWFESSTICELAAASAASFAIFLWHELRTPHPVVDLRILKDKQFAAGLFFSFLLGTSLFATIFYLPLYLQTLLGYNAWETGMVILPGAIASGVTMAVLGRLVQQINIDLRWIAVIGVGIFSISMWQHGHFTLVSGGDDFFWPLILRGVGLGCLFIPLNALALANIPARKMPNATGIYTLVRHLGGSVGIAYAATLFLRFQQSFKAGLSTKISTLNESTRSHQDMLAHLMQQKGYLGVTNDEAVRRLMDNQLFQQASMISFETLFMLFSAGLICALPLLLLMPKAKDIHSTRPSH